ncbi:hypothetical protein HID58_050788 [Brassica napus]|uniref:(rape) hypothetical protein n=1 Tax=Brassica napus TaxID=3708 RepID=A0A816HWJ0_BRANA|nr:hypothetical protein HID58_050788 [Brassica napus]CAF1697617.1 unnamed protein product [Brassica napus]
MAGKMCMMMMVMMMVIMKCDLKACNEIDYMEKDVLCLENCIIKCGEDNYQCQTLCYDDCDPSLIGEERPIMPPGQSENAFCHRDCSIECGSDADCMEPCVKICPETTSLC